MDKKLKVIFFLVTLVLIAYFIYGGMIALSPRL